MKWLLLALIILSQQPAKAPKGSGAPKCVVSDDAQESKTTRNSKANSSPSASNLPQMTAANPQSNATETHSNMNPQGTDWIKVFTGLLVFVGFLQAGVMILQWCTYRRQARIMAHQSGEMTRQRVTMRSQLDAMREQLSEMSEQTKVLKDSVAHAGTSAESALRSVKLQEAQLRQWVNIEDLELHSRNTHPTSAQATLTLSFQVVNNTRMVLTLKELATKTFDDSEFTRKPLDYTLPPEEGYPYKMEVEISGAALQKYQEARFVIPFIGRIAFEDAFETLRHQDFEFDCHCGPQNWFDFRVHEGEIPKKKDGDAK